MFLTSIRNFSLLHVFRNAREFGDIGGVHRRQSVPVDSAIDWQLASQTKGKTFYPIG